MLGTEDRDGIMVKDKGLGLALIFLSSRAGVVSFVLFCKILWFCLFVLMQNLGWGSRYLFHLHKGRHMEWQGFAEFKSNMQ